MKRFQNIPSRIGNELFLNKTPVQSPQKSSPLKSSGERVMNHSYSSPVLLSSPMV